MKSTKQWALDGKRIKIYSIVVTILVLCDQITKFWAIHRFKNSFPITYFNDFFRFEYAENTGAFLSFGANFSEFWRIAFFVILTGIFIGFSIYYILTKKLSTLSQIGFVFIISGGIGNLIDRSFRGYVVDFMNMGIGSLRTGIFNIADMAIVLGIVMLFLVKEPHDGNH